MKSIAPAPSAEERARDLFLQIAKATPRYLPPETQVAEIILEVRSASVRLEQVADQTEGSLKVRAYEMVEALKVALSRFFGGE